MSFILCLVKNNLYIYFKKIKKRKLLIKKIKHKKVNPDIKIFLNYFKENAYLLNDGYRPIIDYLKVVDNLIGGN